MDLVSLVVLIGIPAYSVSGILLWKQYFYLTYRIVAPEIIYLLKFDPCDSNSLFQLGEKLQNDEYYWEASWLQQTNLMVHRKLISQNMVRTLNSRIMLMFLVLTLYSSMRLTTTQILKGYISFINNFLLLIKICQPLHSICFLLQNPFLGHLLGWRKDFMFRELRVKVIKDIQSLLV